MMIMMMLKLRERVKKDEELKFIESHCTSRHFTKQCTCITVANHHTHKNPRTLGTLITFAEMRKLKLTEVIEFGLVMGW